MPLKRSSGSARAWLLVILAFGGIAGLTVLLLALLTNIFERRQEARQPFVRVVEVTEETMDPKPWGQNWPHEYDSYLKTALPTATKYGVVMGTSHEAPMMRGIEEWNRHAVNGTDPYGGNGQWSFRTNSDALKAYWRDGAERMRDQGIEGVITLGMRGNGESAGGHNGNGFQH